MFHLPLFRHARPAQGPRSEADRRRYARVKAPILVRPAGKRSGHRPVVDIGIGGFRVYSDEPFQLDERLTVELLLPEDTTVECLVRVAWIKLLDEGAPAAYDLGLEILKGQGNGLETLSRMIEAQTVDLES